MVVESCFLFSGGGDIGLSFVLALLSFGRVLMASVSIVHGWVLVVRQSRAVLKLMQLLPFKASFNYEL